MYRTRLVAFVLMVGMLPFAAATKATAQTETAEKKPEVALDPTGTWRWDYEIDGNTLDFELKLNWDSKRLTGKYTGLGRTTDIEEAQFEKDQVSLITKREINGTEYVAKFEGTLEPDEIDGTVTINIDDEDREFPWNPQRAVELDNVLGTWQLRVETETGVVEPKLTITKDFGKLKGKSVSQVFGELEAKNLQLKDNVLTWEISGSNGGFDISVKYSGKPRGNSIEGTNEFSVGGNTGTMTFTGKRTPPGDKGVGAAKKAAEAKPAKEADAAESAVK